MAEYLGSAMQRGALGVGGVPQVDRLWVRVVTDAYHHAFERSGKVGEVGIERSSFALAPKKTPQTLKSSGRNPSVAFTSIRSKENESCTPPPN